MNAPTPKANLHKFQFPRYTQTPPSSSLFHFLFLLPIHLDSLKRIPSSLSCFLHPCIARDFVGQGSSAVGMEGGASATTAVGTTTYQVCVLWGQELVRLWGTGWFCFMNNIKKFKCHKILKTPKLFPQQSEMAQQHLTCPLSTRDIHRATFFNKDKSNC